MRLIELGLGALETVCAEVDCRKNGDKGRSSLDWERGGCAASGGVDTACCMTAGVGGGGGRAEWALSGPRAGGIRS